MRTADKVAAIALTAGLAFSMTGCGTTAKTAPALASATATVVAATPTPAPTLRPTAVSASVNGKVTPENRLGIDWAKQTPFTGPAVKKFGAANVMIAYQHAVEFALIEGYTNLMARGYDAKLVEFSFVKPFLAPAFQQSWDTAVKKALAHPGDEVARSSVYGLTLWDFDGRDRDYRFRTGQSVYVLDQTFSLANASVVDTTGGNGQLALAFTVSRNIRAMRGAKAVLVPLERRIVYAMIPNGLKDHPWLITGMTTTTTQGIDVPDPLGATL